MRRILSGALLMTALFLVAGLAIATRGQSPVGDDAGMQLVFRTSGFKDFPGSRIIIMKADGSDPQAIGGDGYVCSPDGRYLLVWSDEAWVINASDASKRSVNLDTASLTHPMLSNSGEVTVFILGSGNHEAALISEGSVLPQNTIHFPFSISGSDITLSPDHTRIAFVENNYAGRIQVINIETSEIVQVNESGRFPEWSPDGSMILWLSPDNFLYVTDIAHHLSIKLAVAHFSRASWSPSGDEIAFVWNDQIFAINANGRNKRQLTSAAFIPGGVRFPCFLNARPESLIGP